MNDWKDLGSQSQSMNNVLGNVTFGDGKNEFTFAPQQIIQISADKIKLDKLNPISPYRGLKPFENDEFDSNLFFGRDQLILRLMQNLNLTDRNLVLLLGASGSGKSSVIKAGLIPQLRKSLGTKFCEIVFKPDRNPFLSLFAALLGKVGDQSKASIALSGQPETLIEIVSTLNKPEDYWLIYIDQFEELFTSSESDKRDNFIKGLGLLYQFLRESQRQSVKIVMTMRADFLDRFDPFPELSEITRGNIELITTMYEDELRQAIEQPAAKHGVVFEDGLVKTIIEDIKGQSGSLPLLQYTLDLLWKKDNIADPTDFTKPHPQTDRTLNISTYTSLGGVRGALQSHIEEVYTQKLKTSEQENATKQIFLKLIKWTSRDEGQDIPVSQRCFMSDFKAEIEIETLKIFINERLIVSNVDSISQKAIPNTSTTGQQATVEIAHEILINAWERLKNWLAEAKDVLIAKSQLRADMDRYKEVWKGDEEKAKDELLMGSRLERILELRANRMFELIQLSEEEAKFIEQSIEWRDRNNRIKEARNLVFVVNELIKRDLTKAVGMAKMAYSLDSSHTLPQVSSVITKAYYSVVETNSSFYIANLSHEADVIVVKYSPDGQKILTASTDGNVKLWNPKGKLIKTIEHKERLRNASFSHNGSKIITVGDKNLVKMWDGNGNFIKDLVGHGQEYIQWDSVNSIAFSPDDETIVTVSSDNKVIMWDGQGNIIKELWDHHNIVTFTTFSPDGKHFVTCGGWEDSSTKIYRLDGQLVDSLEMDEGLSMKEHGWQCGITSAAFSPDSQLLVTTSRDHTVKMWNINGEHIKTLKHESDVNLVVFSPDGKFFATGSYDRTAIIWDREGNKYQVLKGHEDSVTALAFSRTSGQIATGSADSTAKLWDVEKGTLLSVYEAHNSTINSLTFSPCGGYLVTASTDRTAKIWKVDSLKQVSFYHDDQIISAKFVPLDDNKVITASHDLKVRLWNANTGKLIREYGGFGSDRYGNRRLYSLDVSSDGKYFLTTGTDYQIRIWSLESGELLKSWDGDQIYNCTDSGWCGATNARYSHDGKYIVTCDFGGKVKLWDSNGDFLREYEGHSIEVNGIDISKDNKYIATGSHDKTIKLWDFGTGKLIHIFEGHQNAVNQVSFAPDGNSIISASEDQTSKLWDLQGKIILNLNGHGDAVRSAAFSPCGQYIITSSHDKKARIWDLKGKIISTLEGHTAFLRSANFSPSGNNIVTASEDKTAKLWKLPPAIFTELSKDSLEICPITKEDLENYGIDTEILHRAGCLSNSQDVQSQEDIQIFDSQASAQSFYSNALQLIKNKALVSAIAMLDQAISCEADYIQAYFQRGIIFYQIKRYLDAIKDLTKVLAHQHLADAYFCRGLCYQQINNPEMARSDWQMANTIYEKKMTNSSNAKKVKDLLNHQ